MGTLSLFEALLTAENSFAYTADDFNNCSQYQGIHLHGKFVNTGNGGGVRDTLSVRPVDRQDPRSGLGTEMQAMQTHRDHPLLFY
jgi:hypothetical protein